MVFGFYIGLEAPGWTNVMNCLLHGIRPKDLRSADTAPGAIWPVSGVPVTLRTDGAGEFKNLSETDVFHTLDMNLIRCARGMGKDKPYIERFAGTANRNFTATLPGRSFSNPKERGEYKAQTHATLTLNEVRQRFLIWVVDYYHNRPHTGRDMYNGTPLNVWRELAHRMRPQQVSDDDLVACLSIVVKSKITSEGIETEGLQFHSKELATYIQDARRHSWDEPKIRLDPRNLKEILVLSRRGEWMRVPKKDSNPQIADNLTLSQWRAYRKQKALERAPSAAEHQARNSARDRISKGTRPTQVIGSGRMADKFDRLDKSALDTFD